MGATTLPTLSQYAVDNGWIGGAAISSDGRSAYVMLQEWSVRTWPIVVHYWPEWAGVLVALMALVLLRVMWRVWRRRREIGEPYCRTCNYRLTGCASDRCPECGKRITGRGRVIGRPIRWRIVALTGSLLLLIGTYAGLRLAGVPRDGAVSKWFDWRSAAVARWLPPKHPLLTSWVTARQSVESLVEIDVATGRERGRIYNREFRDSYGSTVLASDDGRSLYVRGRMTVERWDLATGRCTWRQELERSPRRLTMYDAVDSTMDIALTSDGQTLAVLVMLTIGGGEFRSSELHRWDTTTGQALPILRLEPRKSDDAGPPLNRLACIPGTQRLLALGECQGQVIDAVSGEVIANLKPPEGLRFDFGSMAIGDAGLYCGALSAPHYNGRSVHPATFRGNLSTGEVGEALGFRIHEPTALTPDSRILIGQASSRPRILPRTRDVQLDAISIADGQTVASFQTPEFDWIRALGLSRDGRRMVVVGTMRAPNGLTVTPVCFYDTTPLSQTATSAR